MKKILTLLLLFFFVFSKAQDKPPTSDKIRQEIANNSGFRKNIKFNHLYVVIDDSTYKYLFDSLKFPNDFSMNEEATINSGSESWTGKYLSGYNNYLEIIKTGGAQGVKFGDLGLGFMTNKMGTIDSLQNYWGKTLDSVHIQNRVINDENGKSIPWFKSVSIPNVDSLKITPWVMENTKEEMARSGFTDNDFSREIKSGEYFKHFMASRLNVPIDSIKYDKLFDKVISLQLSLSDKELSYLRKFLLDIGFTEKENSFLRDDFKVSYSITESKHFLLKEIGFSLLRTSPNRKYSFGKMELHINGEKAILKLKYD